MDADLFRSINDFAKQTSWLHGPASSYAQALGPAVLALLVLGALWFARRRESVVLARAAWAGLAPLVAVALNQPLVHAFDRARPFAALPNVLLLIHHGADAGFPSDHAVLGGSVLAALFLVDRRFGWAAAAAGVLLAAARVYVGAHYPGDVAAGLAFGALVALLGWAVLGGVLVSLVEALRRTRMGRVITP